MRLATTSCQSNHTMVPVSNSGWSDTADYRFAKNKSIRAKGKIIRSLDGDAMPQAMCDVKVVVVLGVGSAGGVMLRQVQACGELRWQPPRRQDDAPTKHGPPSQGSLHGPVGLVDLSSG